MTDSAILVVTCNLNRLWLTVIWSGHIWGALLLTWIEDKCHATESLSFTKARGNLIVNVGEMAELGPSSMIVTGWEVEKTKAVTYNVAVVHYT